jgi:hypothetical protein
VYLAIFLQQHTANVITHHAGSQLPLTKANRELCEVLIGAGYAVRHL